MWLGIVIASVLGLALLYALFTAFSFARQRRFGAAIAIAVPTCLVGYFFVSLAAPAIWIEIAGDPNLESLSDDAVKVPGNELQALYEDRIHTGMYYDDGEWFHFRETHASNGVVRGKGGPDYNPDQWSWSGAWKIENGQVCHKYDGDFSCSDVYRSGDTYQYADDPDGDVESWFTIATPVVQLDPTADQLTGDALRRAIENMTLVGRLEKARGAVNFKAQFFASNHAVYTVRGSAPDQLDEEEYGWYRFDDDRLCLSGTLDTHRHCFEVYQTADGLNFVLGGGEVQMTTDLPL